MSAPDCKNTLSEILAFCKEIDRRMAEYGITEESLETNRDHADLILMPLCQIGESVQRSRDALEEAYPSMPWHKMAGLRNVIIHGYMKVDAAAIYHTVEDDIPTLRKFCERVRQAE